MIKKIKLSYLFCFCLLFLLPPFVSSNVTPRSDYDHLVSFDEGTCSFSYSVKGNKGDNYNITINMDGLLVYADLHLSYLLDANIPSTDNSCNTYWIYAQKLNVNFGGHTKGESTHDSSDIYREDTYEESWSFSRNFVLPLPVHETPNKINAWRSQIDKQQKEQGCSALVVIRDRRSVGGDVKVFPHFSISPRINKKNFRMTAKGHQKYTGNQINLDRNGSLGCGFGFNGVIPGVNFHSEALMKIDDYGYNLPDPVFSTQNFSLEGFGCSGQGNGSYRPKYYVSKVNTPYTTVQSDSEHTVSWSYNLSLAKGVNAFIETAPKDWRPKGGDETNIISIRAYLEEKEKKGIFRFILSETSKEKGTALNKGEEDGFDFDFERNQTGFRQPIETSDGWEIESENKQAEATVSIEAKDYGAWAKLKAQVQVAGVWHDCKTVEGKPYVTLPYDEDEDHIADSWEKKYHIYNEPAGEDNDNDPMEAGNPAEPGDGYSNYEEYRGFFVNGIWKETDPTRKDIFIYDELGFGVGLFTELGLTISLITQTEFDDDKFVNFNRGYGTLASQNGQKGLYLRGGFIEGALGFSQGIGCPNVVGDIIVDSLTIWKHAVFQVMGKSTNMYEYSEINDQNISSAKGSVVRGSNTHYDVTITDAPIEYNAAIEAAFLKLLNQTIAHELGHGVNMTHHGEDSRIIRENSDLENYLDNYRNEDPVLEFIPGDTAVTGGIWSGNVSCLMRYGPPSNYLGWDNRIYAYPDNEGDTKSSYCTHKEGTFINAPPPKKVGRKTLSRFRQRHTRRL